MVVEIKPKGLQSYFISLYCEPLPKGDIEEDLRDLEEASNGLNSDKPIIIASDANSKHPMSGDNSLIIPP